MRAERRNLTKLNRSESGLSRAYRKNKDGQNRGEGGRRGRNYRKRFVPSFSRPLLPLLLPPSSFSRSFSCMDRCSAGTSMLSGDKVLFFTKPPSVAQARPIRRQWLVNSSQSGGKPRRDRGNGVILLMNYLSGQNNNVLSPFHSSTDVSFFSFSLPSLLSCPDWTSTYRVDETKSRKSCSCSPSSRSLLINERQIFRNILLVTSVIVCAIYKYIYICTIYENQRTDSRLVNSSYRLKCFQ